MSRGESPHMSADLIFQQYIKKDRGGNLEELPEGALIRGDDSLYLRISSLKEGNVLSDPHWGYTKIVNEDVPLSHDSTSSNDFVCRLKGKTQGNGRSNTLSVRMLLGQYNANEYSQAFNRLNAQTSRLVEIERVSYDTVAGEKYLILRMKAVSRGWIHVQVPLEVEVNLVRGITTLQGTFTINHNQRRGRKKVPVIDVVEERVSMAEPVAVADILPQASCELKDLESDPYTLHEYHPESPVLSMCEATELQLIQMSLDLLAERSMVSLPQNSAHWMRRNIYSRLYTDSPYMACIRSIVACKSAAYEVRAGDVRTLDLASAFFKRAVKSLWEAKLAVLARTKESRDNPTAPGNEDELLCLSLIPEVLYDYHHMNAQFFLQAASEIFQQRLAHLTDQPVVRGLNHPVMPFILINRFWLEFTDCLLAFKPMLFDYKSIIRHVSMAGCGDEQTLHMIQLIFSNIIACIEIWNGVTCPVEMRTPSLAGQLVGYLDMLDRGFVAAVTSIADILGESECSGTAFVKTPVAAICSIRVAFQSIWQQPIDLKKRDYILGNVRAESDRRERIAIDIMAHLAVAASEVRPEEIDVQAGIIGMIRKSDPFLIGRGGFFLRLLYNLSQEDTLDPTVPWDYCGYTQFVTRYRASEVEWLRNCQLADNPMYMVTRLLT